MSDAQQETAPVFHIQRIYMKDMSFETPKTPQIFQDDWKPSVSLEVTSDHALLTSTTYEVVSRLTVTAKMKDEIAFICEIQQAGIFTIEGIPEAGMEGTLGSYCPNILYPYARESVSALVMRGSFPQLNLGPINFDALLAAKKKKQEEIADQAEKAEEA